MPSTPIKAVGVKIVTPYESNTLISASSHPFW